MLLSCSIEPNMINAPWLDKPTRIIESELDDLELNYQTMLNAIRNDTFVGIMPPNVQPKLNINDLPQQHTNLSNDTPSIDIFTEETQSNHNLLSSHDIFQIDEVNQSVQRVRMQLNMTNASSPSVSPIQRTANNSLININFNQISRSVHQPQPDDDDESKHNLSLPFMSPSNDDPNSFISDSISPPMFHNLSSQRSRSEQPSLQTSNLNSSAFSSAPPRLPHHGAAPTPPQIISLEQLNQTQSQILSHFGVPDSVTSSMMLTPANTVPAVVSNDNSHYNFHTNDSASFDINNHNNDRAIPSAPQRPNYRNRYRRNVRGPSRMVHVINDSSSSIDFAHHHHMPNIHNISELHSIQHDFVSTEHIDSSSFGQSIDDGSTPTNIQIRSHSVSLEAPRPQRRQQSRRYDGSSVDLTANNT